MHRNIRNKLSIIVMIALIFSNKTLGKDFSENKSENPISNKNNNLILESKEKEKKSVISESFSDNQNFENQINDNLNTVQELKTGKNSGSWFSGLSKPKKYLLTAGLSVGSLIILRSLVKYLRQNESQRSLVKYLRQNESQKKYNKPEFLAETPKEILNELIFSEKIKKQIKNILTKIKNYDILYNKFGLKKIDKSGGRTLINLYGPPGTGKSSCAKAIANELGKKFILVNYAELESEWVGQTAKNIKAVFRMAKEQDAILIFDEADTILGKRLSNVVRANDHEVNLNKAVMLLEMDSFSGIVIFTTNFGKNYDSAFVRRIIGHIEFTLPDLETRKRIFENMIPSEFPIQISSNEKTKIIRDTEGFSGGDFSNMLVNAALSAVMRSEEIGENIEKCKVNINDFESAIESIKKAKIEIGESTENNKINLDDLENMIKNIQKLKKNKNK